MRNSGFVKKWGLTWMVVDELFEDHRDGDFFHIIHKRSTGDVEEEKRRSWKSADLARMAWSCGGRGLLKRRIERSREAWVMFTSLLPNYATLG